MSSPTFRSLDRTAVGPARVVHVTWTARQPLRLLAAVLAIAACAPTRQAPPVVAPPAANPAPVVTAPPTRPALPREGMIEGGAGRLWYQVAGSGPDTMIVPLASWFSAPLAPLADRHTVVFYDPRHRGRSHVLTDTAAATFEGDVADLEAVRAAIGASRVAVIAYDYYGAVAAAWAARYPQAATRLVLLSPIEPRDSLAQSWNPAERMARIDTVDARALVKARAAGRDTMDLPGYCSEFWRVNARVFVGDTAFAPAAARAEWCALPNESPARVAAAAGGALASLGSDPDLIARAAGLTAPVLVLHGRRDLVANPDGAVEWARRLPDARLLWLSNVGHLPHLEAPSLVVQAIAEFLAGRWPARAARP